MRILIFILIFSFVVAKLLIMRLKIYINLDDKTNELVSLQNYLLLLSRTVEKIKCFWSESDSIRVVMRMVSINLNNDPNLKELWISKCYNLCS